MDQPPLAAVRMRGPGLIDLPVIAVPARLEVPAEDAFVVQVAVISACLGFNYLQMRQNTPWDRGLAHGSFFCSFSIGLMGVAPEVLP